MDKLLNRSFVSIVIVQIASLFGDAVLRFALPLYVLNVTGSAALMGAVSAAAWLPYLVLTPIGGVAADRVNKRRIMAVLDTLLALDVRGVPRARRRDRSRGTVHLRAHRAVRGARACTSPPCRRRCPSWCRAPTWCGQRPW